MDVENSSEVQAKLSVLRDKFLVRAQDDMALFRSLAAAAHAGQVTPAKLLDGYQRLHRLAGSAGTFGLPELGAAARMLEKQLRHEAESVQSGDLGDNARVRVPADIVERIEALVVLAGAASVSVTKTERDTGPVDVQAPSHGTQVRVILVDSGEPSILPLADELLRYGFVVQLCALDHDGCPPTKPDRPVLADALTGVAGAAAIVCTDAALNGVMATRDRVVPNPKRHSLPVICLASDPSFGNKYQMAKLGAQAIVSQPVGVPELAERIESLAIERSAGVQGRVVIVEDDTELAEHYGLILTSAGIETQVVMNPLDLMATLSAFQPDLVLMDVQMGAYSGVTLARMIRFEPRWLSLPIIYLSSEDDPDNQLEALSKGADEFLTKPVSDDYLVRSIRIRCHRARQLSELMNRDSLTGLLKHSLIKQEVDKELARCRRESQPAAVVMLDLDHFKRINDTHGHRAGDGVIKALANMLRNRLRDTDRIGRYGGEEFLVVMPGCDGDKAVEVMSAIAVTFSELVFTAGDETFRVTVSGGIARLNDFATGDDAIESADEALYDRKRVGRNGITLYVSEDAVGECR